MVGDGLRLAVTTLTGLPARGPRAVDRPTAGRAMLLAPLVGLGLGLAAGLVLLALRVFDASEEGLLPALGAVATLAVLTRGLHLDGLADTADGLGSGRPAAGALEVMRRSDIGPFGVVTIGVVGLAQVLALAICAQQGRGTEGIVLAAVVGRIAVVMACGTGLPAARAEGLGALVAETLPRSAWLGWAVPVALLAAAWGYLDEGAGAVGAVRAVLAVAAGLGAAALLLRHCRRRLGGVTGDVIGAAVETAATATLLVVAAERAW
jgi:adenosylcobinamide-GDP ribazoletransferase